MRRRREQEALACYKLQVTGYRLQVTGYKLQATGYRLQVAGSASRRGCRTPPASSSSPSSSGSSSPPTALEPRPTAHRPQPQAAGSPYTARSAALFRRLGVIDQPPSPGTLRQRGKLALDIGRLTVQWGEQPVPLTVTEFWMVHALAKFPGHVKSRQVLMQESKIFVDGS